MNVLTSPVVLHAETAADVMTANPVSLRAGAAVQEAVALLTERGFSAAPVIDEAGRPVGVLSRTDLLVHERECGHRAALSDLTEWDVPPRSAREGFSVEVVDPTLVRDVMTPFVFTVSAGTPVAEVVRQMLSLKVHHLFVVDDDAVLVGIISSLDILRRLR
jgi:CBS domain-containing protein